MPNQTARQLLHRALALESPQAAQELYRDWAGTYDQTMLADLGYLTPSVTARLLFEHLPAADALILDVGSGTGLAGAELNSLGCTNLHALDFSAAMLAQAASRGIYDKTIEADLTLPLALSDSSYDALISTGTFTHAHVGAACLDELFRILKPGGLFACTIHKDVFEPAGFRAAIVRMEQSGVLSRLYFEPGPYYSTSTEPDGWFIVFRAEA
jgi:predicted TPR repeat methyltransferase